MPFFFVVKSLNSYGYSPHLRLEKEQNYFANSVHFIALQALNDIPPIVELWYHASVKAHDFISPSLWKSHKKKMAEKYLPQSETYVAVKNQEMVGFISMVDNYLAAIFVKTELQGKGKGIGTALLNFIKENRKNIELKVLKKNTHSVAFYNHSGFTIVAEEIEENTNEPELIMVWSQ